VFGEQEDKGKWEKESEENLQGKKDGRGHNVRRVVKMGDDETVDE
jgi:hypothetical protein